MIGITTDYDDAGEPVLSERENMKAVVECGGIPVGIFAPAGRPVQWSGGAEQLLEDYTVDNTLWEVLDEILSAGERT
ncbi:MAG: hypothetical protein ACLR23_06800 [Clostridia bacterium]